MSTCTAPQPRHFLFTLAAVSLLVALGFIAAGCGDPADVTTTLKSVDPAPTAVSERSTATTAPAGTTSTTDAARTTDTSSLPAAGLFAAEVVHDITVVFSQADYDAMIESYKSSGDKDWIEATVTVDGVTYAKAGMRLKGNSSIMGLRNGGNGRGPGAGVSAGDPETLPWLIRLDKNVDGQNHLGVTDLVIRSNTSKTSLNEAVALQLLDQAGLASLRAAACRFSVNGSDQVLRLVTELPNDAWMQEHFGSTGALYKAESGGDYSYRGADPRSYEEVFDQEAGKDNTDLTPLIEFLDFINNADADTFNTELPDRLDIDAFATYLAVEELLGNFDDIDGPGNNSYLHYDPATDMFTIVPWDHNLAFGGMGGKGDAGGNGTVRPGGWGGTGATGGGQAPAVGGDAGKAQAVGGDANRRPGQAFGPRGKSNILVERFHANPDFEALYKEKLVELTGQLYDSGAAQDVLDEWVQVLKDQASDLVDPSTVDLEAAKIASYFEAD
jgi:spore coat protein CotH